MYENIGLLQCMGSSIILGFSKVLQNPKKAKKSGTCLINLKKKILPHC